MRNVEKDVVEEIMKECSWYERLVVKLFKRVFVKIYGVACKNNFNNLNKYI